MANTHVLFQPNRDFFLIGFICDWDMDKGMPIVEVLALSWINPPNTSWVQITGNSNASTGSPSRPGRNVRAAVTQQPTIGGNQEMPVVGGSQGPSNAREHPVPDGDIQAIAGSSRFPQLNEINPSPTAPTTPSPRKRGKMAAPDNQK
ncbi:hypothetical protein PGT21_034406 [Puccinia graminis f. sp. tritici]|uniref:Uncharacterized protein n=1 Tax=Puccinia graminis f. sp. tritici TaxID=56615 RepID=A0A5B0QCH2_PUCGR|nr:hypothetical protein PGT21_034406 [Puccinia graminis f. sp. tritici]